MGEFVRLTIRHARAALRKQGVCFEKTVMIISFHNEFRLNVTTEESVIRYNSVRLEGKKNYLVCVFILFLRVLRKGGE